MSWLRLRRRTPANMPDTHGKPGSATWIMYWFPEYIVGGKPIFLKTGVGRFSGARHTRETSPWKYAQNEYSKVNIYGVINEPVPGKWYNSMISTPVSTKEYAAFIKSLNYYTNGKLTMYGGPGLDPSFLIGGYRGIGRRKPYLYHCNKGIYTAETFGKPATFHFRKSKTDPWIGDHQLKDYDWVKH
jgi:hypothetical protein